MPTISFAMPIETEDERLGYDFFPAPFFTAKQMLDLPLVRGSLEKARIKFALDADKIVETMDGSAYDVTLEVDEASFASVLNFLIAEGVFKTRLEVYLSFPESIVRLVEETGIGVFDPTVEVTNEDGHKNLGVTSWSHDHTLEIRPYVKG